MANHTMAFRCQTGNSLTHISILLLLMLLGFSTTSNAQKVKIKNEIATVDGEDYVKVISPPMVNEVSIYELNSEDEIIFMQYFNYSDPSKVSNGNPQGMVRWVEVKFLNENLVCEISTRTPKGLIKVLYENNIFVDGKLNVENAQKFVTKYGTSFTDNKPATIIIR